MKNPLAYYEKHLEIYNAEVKTLYKKMTALSVYRLLVFAFTGLGVYTFFQNWQWAVFIGVLGIAVFLYLLSKYNDVKAKRHFNEPLLFINDL